MVFKFKMKGQTVSMTCYIQLKHKFKGQSITMQDITATSDGPFSMFKHFKSYHTTESKNNKGKHTDGSFENCQFIIYTNSKLEGRPTPANKWTRNDPLRILNS
jgi:hypothetical protein